MAAQPILVVGAGTTGLVMACELARHGAPARIVDKLPGPLPSCRASGIHSRSLEVFQDLGVVDEVLAAGQPMRRASQYANGERFARLDLGDVDSPYPLPVSLEQSRTEAILEALLGRLGGAVERETEFVAMEERLGGVRATLRGPDGSVEQVDAPWLVACDGAHSTLRHLDRVHFSGETDPRRYALADVVALPAVEPDEMHFFLSDRGAAWLFPLPAGRSLAIASWHDPRDPIRDAPTAEEMEAILRERGAAGLRLGDPRWTSFFRVHYRQTRHYRYGRAFLAGDAAHIHSPIGGQGMNTGIQDAYNLAWKLALVWRGRAPYALLESYEKERHAVAEDVLETTRRATEAAEGFAHLSVEERDRLYFHASLSEHDRSRAARHREELDLDYRRSPICREHHGGTLGAPVGPHAGAQAVDAGPLLLGDRTLRLFELLRGTRHTLLVFDGSESRGSRRHLAALAEAAARGFADRLEVVRVVPGGGGTASSPVATLCDPDGALHRRFGARSECLYLIRPDGYVGFRSQPVSLRALGQYLEQIFTPGPG